MSEEEYEILLNIMWHLIGTSVATEPNASEHLLKLSIADNQLRALIRSKQNDLK